MTESRTVRGHERLALAYQILLDTPEDDEYDDDNQCLARLLKLFFPPEECVLSGREVLRLCAALLKTVPAHDEAGPLCRKLGEWIERTVEAARHPGMCAIK